MGYSANGKNSIFNIVEKCDILIVTEIVRWRKKMEYAKIEVTVPKEMQIYFSDSYSFDSDEESQRNALLLYPYIHNNIISHGRAAEILGIKKLDLIDLYDKMGFPYFDMDISEVEKDMQTFENLKKEFA